jgi:Raf kinase inhibitor-like YbhB/YbcL family protein
MVRTQSTAALLACAAAVLAGCGPEKAKPPAAPAKIRLSSPAFRDGGTIPRRYTCDGEGATPPLRWSGAPAGIRELALFVDDPDAPAGPFVHWVVFGVRPATTGLPAGTKPATLRKAQASSGKVGYEPPCPPEGARPHRYRFTLYALRAPIGLQDGAPADQVRAAIERSAIARGALVGRYGR